MKPMASPDASRILTNHLSSSTYWQHTANNLMIVIRGDSLTGSTPEFRWQPQPEGRYEQDRHGKP